MGPPPFPGSQVDTDLTRLLGQPWREIKPEHLRERMAALPVTDLAHIASELDIDPLAFLALVLDSTTPADNQAHLEPAGQEVEVGEEVTDAWELHALLLYVGGVGARHTEAAEALGWELARLERATRTLTALLHNHRHYDLAYYHGGRLRLRPTGYRPATRLSMRIRHDVHGALPISAEHAAVLRVLPFPFAVNVFGDSELPYKVIDELIDAGLAVHRDDGSVMLSPDAELSTTAQPQP